MSGHADFAANDYGILSGLVPAETARLCAGYALANRNLPRYYAAEAMHNSWGRYADSIGEVILAQVQPKIEELTGLALFPAYSYLRIYCPGSVLLSHIDRPSCEISATLTLGGDAAQPWPIWVKSKDGPRAIELPPGDGMVYRGTVVPHWRERFEGRFWIQLFLHYVRRDGQFAQHRFDGREHLGPVAPGENRPHGDVPRQFAAEDPCPCGSGRSYASCHGAVPGA
ncbi:MAG TPA: SEC-C domain-containing protein [Gammaproteobacteria bacterium]|nr:SEC-C domain-containing protein [Gammaproteobacteria bacterium]